MSRSMESTADPSKPLLCGKLLRRCDSLKETSDAFPVAGLEAFMTQTAARLGWQKAREFGFLGSIAEWERLMSANPKR